MVVVWLLALASDYPELIEKIIVDALPCLPALMNPTFKTVKQDCSAMLNQIVQQRMNNTQCKMSIQRLVADTSKKRIGNRLSMKSDRKNFVENCDFFKHRFERKD
jgi:hypothetical protein